MARKKRDKTNGTAQAGHNSTLTDEEQRALTLHHKRAYEAADALVEKAKSDRTAVSNLAKSDLGKGALADIKDMITYADEKKCKGQIERTLRLARWLGMPVGTSVDLFDAPVDDRAAADGMTAGMAGDECKPPIHLTAEGSQRWIQNWHEGQKILASAFQKKREPKVDPAPVEPPTPASTQEASAVAH